MLLGRDSIGSPCHVEHPQQLYTKSMVRQVPIHLLRQGFDGSFNHYKYN